MDRQIQGLEADSARLTGEINNLTTATQGSTTATEADTTTKEDATEAAKSLSEIYETLTARIQDYSNLQNTLAEQQRQTTDFFRLTAGELMGYGDAVDAVIPSVTDAEQEQQALNAAVQAGIDSTSGDPLGDYVDGLELTSEAAGDALGVINEVGESINNADFTQAEAELYDFQDAVENTKRSHIDFRDVVDRETTPAIEDLTTATDMAKQAAEESASAFDALDMVMSDVPDATQMATNSFLDFSDDAIRAVDNIVQAFDPLFAVVGDTAGEIANFSTLISSLATGNVLGIISSTANIVLPGLTDPQRILDFEGLPTVEGDPRQIDTSALGLTPVQIEELDFSGVAPGLRALLGLEGGEGGFNVFQAQSRTQGARSFAEATGTDRQAIEDVAREQYGAADYAAEVAAATAEALEDNIQPPDLQAIPEIQNIFDLTSEQEGILAPLEQAVDIAQGVVDDLNESSTPQEIAEAYTNLANAEQAVNDTIVGFITNATNITEDARNRAFTLQGQLFGNEIERANTDLIDALEATGLQVIGGLTNMSEILRGSALQFQQIPEEIQDIAAPEQEQQTTEPEALRDVFRFTGAQSAQLSTLAGHIENAEDAITLLTEDSTPEEVTEAYTRLGEAEIAYFNQQLAFVNEGVGIFTDQALATARQDYAGDLRSNLFDANRLLVRALDNIGFELVDMFTSTSGLLTDTALAVQRIPEEAEAAAEQIDPIDPDDPLAPLRSRAASTGIAVRRSRFDLGQATSEEDFEGRRLDLIRAINDDFEAQIALINALGLSEEDLANRTASTTLARDIALQRATNATNTYREARIESEEDAAEAAQRAADDQIEAAERAERERQSILERQQREEERANEQRLREEMRLQDRIDGLRDDAVENEQDRLDSLADARQSYQDRLTRIEEDGIRARQDLQRDANRSREDIEREFQEDFQEIHRQRVFGEISDEEAARQSLELGRQRNRDLRELDIRTGRRQEDIGIREQRQRADSAEGFTKSREQILQESEENARAISEQLAPLLMQQEDTETAEVEAATAQLQNETAMTESTTAMTRAETALTEAGTALAQSEATEAFTTTTDTFSETVDTFREGVDGLLTVPGLIENAFGVVSTQLTDIFTLTTTIAQRLLIPTAPTPPAFVVEGARNAAAPTGGQQAPVEVVVNVQNSDVILDNQKVGQVIGDTIVRQGANRRNLLGRQ